MRIKWTSIYPNPIEISRNKYYDFKVEDNIVFVFVENITLDYNVEQFKEFFTLETGTWDEIFKEDKKKNTKTRNENVIDSN